MDPITHIVTFGAAGAGGDTPGFAYISDSSPTTDGFNNYSSYNNTCIRADSGGNIYIGLNSSSSDVGRIEGINSDGTFKNRYYYSKNCGDSFAGLSFGMLSNDKLLVSQVGTSNDNYFHTTTQPTIASGSPTVAGIKLSTTSYTLEGGVAVDAADNLYFAGNRGNSYDGVELYGYNSSFGTQNFKKRFKRTNTAGMSRAFLACDPSNSSGGVFALFKQSSGTTYNYSTNRYLLKYNASGTLQATYANNEYKNWNASDRFFIDDYGNWYWCVYVHPYWEVTKYNSSGTRLAGARIDVSSSDSFCTCNRAEGGVYIGKRDSSKGSVYIYKLDSSLNAEWSRRMGWKIISDTYYYSNVFEVINAETDNDGNIIVAGRTQTQSALGVTEADTVVVKYLADGAETGTYTVSSLSNVEFKIESLGNPSTSGIGTYTWSSTSALTTNLTTEYSVASHGTYYQPDSTPTTHTTPIK